MEVRLFLNRPSWTGIERSERTTTQWRDKVRLSWRLTNIWWFEPSLKGEDDVYLIALLGLLSSRTRPFENDANVEAVSIQLLFFI